MISGVSYVSSCSSVRAAPGVSLYRSLTLRKTIVAVITEDKVIDGNLKKQIKNQTLYRLFLPI